MMTNGKPHPAAGDALSPLIAALRSARERWVDLAPGKQVRIRRPAEAEFSAFVRTDADGKRTLVVELEHVQRGVVDWRGITEADLLGATVGSVDALPFDAAVWSEAVADRLHWLQPVARALLDAITQHVQAQDDAAGNSGATSTSGPTAGVATVQTPATTTSDSPTTLSH